MTVLSPNPFSPWADADPQARHVFPTPCATPPLPGQLAPTGCERLAVVPPDLTAHIPAQRAPNGLCAACVAAMRGQELPEDIRPVAHCRECRSLTDHDGLCAPCRITAHDQWWPTRNTELRLAAATMEG